MSFHNTSQTFSGEALMCFVKLIRFIVEVLIKLGISDVWQPDLKFENLKILGVCDQFHFPYEKGYANLLQRIKTTVPGGIPRLSERTQRNRPGDFYNAINF